MCQKSELTLTLTSKWLRTYSSRLSELFPAAIFTPDECHVCEFAQMPRCSFQPSSLPFGRLLTVCHCFWMVLASGTRVSCKFSARPLSSGRPLLCVTLDCARGIVGAASYGNAETQTTGNEEESDDPRVEIVSLVSCAAPFKEFWVPRSISSLFRFRHLIIQVSRIFSAARNGTFGKLQVRFITISTFNLQVVDVAIKTGFSPTLSSKGSPKRAPNKMLRFRDAWALGTTCFKLFPVH